MLLAVLILLLPTTHAVDGAGCRVASPITFLVSVTIQAETSEGPVWRRTHSGLSTMC